MKSVKQTIGRELKKSVNALVTDVKNNPKKYTEVSLEYPPNIQNIMNKFGDKNIVSITLKRTPVSAMITGALDALSFGKFGKRMEKHNFDDFFHLFMDIKLENGKTVALEKNERLNMVLNPSKRKNETAKSVSNVPRITLNELMNNTHKRMGNQFFRYDAVKSNCQHFILNVLQANDIGDGEDAEFVKQDTEKLFKNMPMVKKVAHLATDTGAVANKLLSGGSIKKSSAWIEHVKQYSIQHGVSYKEAMSLAKDTYKKK